MSLCVPQTKLSFPQVFVEEVEKDFVKKFSQKIRRKFQNEWETEKFFVSRYYKLDCLQFRFGHPHHMLQKRNLIQTSGNQISLNIYIPNLATIFKQHEFDQSALTALHKMIDKALSSKLKVLKGQKNKKRVFVDDLIDLGYLKEFLTKHF